MIRRRVVITGRLAGTSLRDSYQREAKRLGVRGWALERKDGRIEGVFEGTDAAVQELIDWARVGPAHAYVTSIEVVDEEPSGEDEDFVVR
jgi:acylphosphatase